MTDDQIEKRFDDLEKQNNRVIRVLQDTKTAVQEVKNLVATASSQIGGQVESVHSLAKRFDGILDDAESDSKKIGTTETRITTKQETLLDLQIWNAKGSRILIVVGIISAAVSGTMAVLAFLKWYVHI